MGLQRFIFPSVDYVCIKCICFLSTVRSYWVFLVVLCVVFFYFFPGAHLGTSCLLTFWNSGDAIFL